MAWALYGNVAVFGSIHCMYPLTTSMNLHSSSLVQKHVSFSSDNCPSSDHTDIYSANSLSILSSIISYIILMPITIRETCNTIQMIAVVHSVPFERFKLSLYYLKVFEHRAES